VDPLTHADHGAAQNLWVDVEDRKHLLAELAAKGSLDVALKRLVRRPGERDTGADPIVLDIEQRLDEQRELVGAASSDSPRSWAFLDVISGRRSLSRAI